MVNQTETIQVSLTKSELIVVAFLVGELYRFAVKEKVSEISIGYQELGVLFDKVSEAMTSFKEK